MNIIELKSGESTAKINLSKGANCVSLHMNGLNILRETNSDEPDNPFLYGMPPLFPVNRISGGKFVFEGRNYDFGINEESTSCQLHGELHRQCFTLAKSRNDYALCIFKSEGEYMKFPHSFTLETEYELKKGSLHIRVGIENRSDKNMPFLFGFHTTFNLKLSDTSDIESVRVGVLVGKCVERDKDYLPTGKKYADDKITGDLLKGRFIPAKVPVSRHYEVLDDGKMFIYDLDMKKGIIYENDTAYTHRLIYNGSADEYICLEPQNCIVNAPNISGGYVPFVPPGEKKNLFSSITVFDASQTPDI